MKPRHLYLVGALFLFITNSAAAQPSFLYRIFDASVSKFPSTTGLRPSFSNDGTFMVYTEGNQSLPMTVNLFDATDGSITVMSESNLGGPANDDSFDASISGDGQFIAFRSAATNLVISDANASEDIFLIDRSTLNTIAITDTNQNHTVGTPLVSADGSSVLYTIGIGGSRFLEQFDINSNQIVNQIPISGGIFRLQSVSANGQYAVGEFGPNASPSVLNNHIVLFDLSAGAGPIQIDVSLDGALTGPSSYNASISQDGTYVVFDSYSPDLIGGDFNASRDVFLRDLVNGSIFLISAPTNPTFGLANADSFAPAISGDGTYVIFSSKADNLTDSDRNAHEDVFLFDLVTSGMKIVSSDPSGTQGIGDSYFATINYDGTVASFISGADNLDINDFNFADDLFIIDPGGPIAPDACPANPQKTDPGICGCSVDDVDVKPANGIIDCLDIDGNYVPPLPPTVEALGKRSIQITFPAVPAGGSILYTVRKGDRILRQGMIDASSSASVSTILKGLSGRIIAFYNIVLNGVVSQASPEASATVSVSVLKNLNRKNKKKIRR